MTNEQLLISVGVPILFNGRALFLVTLTLSNRISDVVARMASFEQRMIIFEQRMAGLATKEELRRVEEVLDARLKHIEEELEKR